MKRFSRRKEDFVCEHCGAEVSGSGYTNHCPKCLYSKHVDVMPGDRAEECHGMMRPIGIEMTRDGYIIEHQCEKCGVVKRNKANENDNFEELLHLARSQVDKLKKC
ncbi:MAG: RNHCP domain-containing protein [Alphaproteobacteria bacterium]|nr:RNHCP domain-containing protein [Alphaproteobacteria bacterium]